MGERAHWWHVLIVIVPDNLNPAYSTNSFLYVTGNRNTDSDGTGMPGQTDDDLTVATTIATGVGMLGAAVFQVSSSDLITIKFTHRCPNKVAELNEGC